MRIPSLAILVTLSALTLSITAGAGSPSPVGQTVEGLFGTVFSISPGPQLTLITVETEAGPVEISATVETQVRIPGQRQRPPQTSPSAIRWPSERPTMVRRVTWPSAFW